LGFIHSTTISESVAFFGIIVIVMILARLVGAVLHKIVAGIKLGLFDSLLGGIMGLLIGAVVCGALLALWVKYFSASAVSGSFMAKILLDRFPLVLGLLPSSFNVVKDFFN
jgi:uncharacterized membrane protein required for colicin V production